jgi:hypothetical protein
MDRDLLFSLYRDMIRIRRFEEEAARCYTRWQNWWVPPSL